MADGAVKPVQNIVRQIKRCILTIGGYDIARKDYCCRVKVIEEIAGTGLESNSVAALRLFGSFYHSPCIFQFTRFPGRQGTIGRPISSRETDPSRARILRVERGEVGDEVDREGQLGQ